MHDPATDGDIEETEKINVVPLADLTLVLLIILMVLSPMISQSMIRVATPQVESSSGGGGGDVGETPAVEAVPLLISVGETEVKLNNVHFDTLTALLATLADTLRQQKNRPVIVSADDGVFVGRVVEVLDGARQAGAKEVSLVKSVEGSK
ncbi:MAG: biopolymer transporter ExbD [Elusimicrobia bacterium]|nr:biopolymer transporter ExbD [Elusimicrobiota bacterium]MBP9127966.1 biopolymer transporter ExbD [Elusimicrobiota bacterium]MBP9698721.1 biopolymer transporter ExbD [Elusimicrobiota bacterium]